MPPRILIIGSESSARPIFEKCLVREGFQVVVTSAGRGAIQVHPNDEPDLVIVDLPSTYGEGQEMCRTIRDTPEIRSTPILAIAAQNTNGLSTRCLNNGADVCLREPVDEPELVANVRALLRRPKAYLSEGDVVQKGRMTLRLGERRAFFQDTEIHSLTPKEYALLTEVLLRAPRIVEREALVMKIWRVPIEELGRRTLDVHMQRLRRKLGPAAPYLKTVTLVGYQWIQSETPR